MSAALIQALVYDENTGVRVLSLPGFRYGQDLYRLKLSLIILNTESSWHDGVQGLRAGGTESGSLVRSMGHEGRWGLKPSTQNLKRFERGSSRRTCKP